MNKQYKLSVLTAALAATLLAGAYMADTPPFENRGKIKASEVCRTLGKKDKAAAALPNILPEKEKYSFHSKDGIRTNIDSVSFNSSCFVWAKSKTIFGVTSELQSHSSAKSWISYVVEDSDTSGNPVKFEAGDEAIATGDMAAVYVPCVPRGQSIDKNPWHLTVVADSLEKPAAPEDKARQSLVGLVVEAARYAHKKARCDAPSLLPVETPKV